MKKEYICHGFKSLEGFLAHHRRLAKRGDSKSKDIVDTAVRLALAKLDEEARERAE